MRKIMLVSYWLGWTHPKIMPVEICIDEKCLFFYDYASNCAPDYFMAKNMNLYQSYVHINIEDNFIPWHCNWHVWITSLRSSWTVFCFIRSSFIGVRNVYGQKKTKKLKCYAHRVGRLGGNNLNRSEKYQRITWLCDVSFDNILIVTLFFLWCDCSQFWIIFLGLCVKLCITSSALSL